MGLFLHTGAELIDYDGLRAFPTPEATATYTPLAHHDLVNMVSYALQYLGHEIEKTEFAVKPTGEFFGVLTLKSDWQGHTDLVGLANSHNRTLPITLGVGAGTFVCDNTSFVSTSVMKRRHTPGSKRALPGMIMEMVEPLRDQRIAQNNQFERYKALALQDDVADRLMMQMYRRGIINCSRIADVLEQWENPTCDYGPKTAYRLFNGTTWTLKPKVMEQPQLTRDLHELIDGECVRLN